MESGKLIPLYVILSSVFILLCELQYFLSFLIRFQVLATARDDQSKEETQNIKSGRRVTVSMATVISC